MHISTTTSTTVSGRLVGVCVFQNCYRGLVPELYSQIIILRYYRFPTDPYSPPAGNCLVRTDRTIQHVIKVRGSSLELKALSTESLNISLRVSQFSDQSRSASRGLIIIPLRILKASPPLKQKYLTSTFLSK